MKPEKFQLASPEERTIHRQSGFVFIVVGILSISLGISLFYYGDIVIRHFIERRQAEPSTLTYTEMPVDPTQEETTPGIEPASEDTDITESPLTSPADTPGVSLGYRAALKSCFKVSLYDLKQDAQGRVQDLSLRDVLEQTAATTLNLSFLKKFRMTPFQIYSTSLYHSLISQRQVLTEFGAPASMKPGNLLLHYRGNIQPGDAHPLRFYIYADNPVAVAVDNTVILKKYPEKLSEEPSPVLTPWIKPTKGKNWRLDILLGIDSPAPFLFCILVEEQGIPYHHTTAGAPLLPALRTQENVPMPHDDYLSILPPVDNSFGGVLHTSPVN